MRVSASRLSGVLLAATMLSGVPGVSLDHAQAQSAERQYRFEIPSQPVPQAVNAIGRAAGLSVVVSGGVGSGVRSRPVSGSLTAREALSAALAGTGLTFSFTNGNTVTLFDPSAGVQTGAYAAGGESVQLETIDVTSGSGATAADLPYQTPGSTAHVSAEQISRVPPSSVADIFKGVPGVVSAQGRNGAALDVNIRGMQGMNRVKTTVDGAEQSTSTYRGYFGVDNRTYVDHDLIGGVDITKGPGGSAASGGAPGGVVAITTLTADDILLPGADYGVRLKASKSSNSIDPVIGLPSASARTDKTDLFDADGGSGSIAAAARGENLEVVAAFSKRKTGNYFTGKDGPTHWKHPAIATPREYSYVYPEREAFNTSEDVESALIKGTAKWGDGHSLQLGYIYYDNNYGEITPTIIQTSGQRVLSHTNVENQTAKYRYNPLDNDLIDFRFNLWRTETLDEAYYFSTFSAIQVPTLSKMHGGDVSNTSRIDSTFGAFKLNYGASLSFEDSDVPPGRTSLQTLIGERQVGSVYLNGEWKPLDWLKLNAGGRYDFYEVNSAQGDRDGGEFSPSGGITFLPWDGIQIFGTYSEGIRPATIRETAYSVGNTAFNADLKPERSRNFEIGINTDRSDVLFAGDILRAKLAYFNTTVDDYIFRTIRPGGGVYDYWAENLDKAKFSGVELQVNYDARRVFAELGLSYYDNIEYCRVGQPCRAEDLFIPINQTADYSSNHVPPELMVTGTFGARLFDEALTVGTRVTYANERKIAPSAQSVGISLHWAPFTVVDLFAAYKVNEHVSLNVSAENVTDQFYVDPLGGSPIAAPGRTVRAGLTAKF